MLPIIKIGLEKPDKRYSTVEVVVGG